MYFENAKVWVYGEHENGKLAEITYELLGIASQLASKIGTQVLMMLFDSNEVLNQECIQYGAEYVINVQMNGSNYMEHVLKLSKEMCEIEEPEIVLCGSTEWGIQFAPRLAVRLGAGLTAHCVKLEICEKTGRLLQTRPTSFNNLFATIVSTSNIQMATVKQNIFLPNEVKVHRKGTVIQYPIPNHSKDFSIKRVICKNDESEYDNSNIVIGVGNGIADEQTFMLIKEFAKMIHASVYGSREAVTRGFVGYERQIGISGKSIQPKLYIAIGISGSHNHLIGVAKGTKIVAVNTDITADIVSIADYKIITDAKSFIEKAIHKIKQNA